MRRPRTLSVADWDGSVSDLMDDVLWRIEQMARAYAEPAGPNAALRRLSARKSLSVLKRRAGRGTHR